MFFAYVDKISSTIVLTAFTSQESLERTNFETTFNSASGFLELNDNNKPTHERASEFQEAWEFDDNTNPTCIVINLDKAKHIYKKQLVEMRNQHLVGWDMAMLRALGRNDNTEVERIEQIKQDLRDMPENLNFDGVTSFEELVDFIPPELSAV